MATDNQIWKVFNPKKWFSPFKQLHYTKQKQIILELNKLNTTQSLFAQINIYGK